MTFLSNFSSPKDQQQEKQQKKLFKTNFLRLCTKKTSLINFQMFAHWLSFESDKRGIADSNVLCNDLARAQHFLSYPHLFLSLSTLSFSPKPRIINSLASLYKAFFLCAFHFISQLQYLRSDGNSLIHKLECALVEMKQLAVRNKNVPAD